MEIKRLNRTIQETREQERIAATVERQEALLEYVAIMADIDLPGGDDEERK